MAWLALEDGTLFSGLPFGASGTVCGEIVFNTGLTGYVEVLTDPSYKGQIVTMTYPHIGNYGVTLEDLESSEPHVSGFVVREASGTFSNWRADSSIQEFLRNHGIIGISEIDTRALTLRIREVGAMRACISSEDVPSDDLVGRARAFPSISEQDLVGQVTGREMQRWDDPISLEWNGTHSNKAADFHVVAFDFGIKHNILRSLRSRVSRVTLVPASTPATRVRDLRPDGIFLSNGPGDPAYLGEIIQTIHELIQMEIPIFGICLGHQLLGLAMGAKSYKLKFGHRGCNQPVKNLETGRVEITTHNHGFALRDLPDDLVITHLSLNDNTIEGFRHKRLPIFAVQYHPEAAPGPHDSDYLFESFVEMMKEGVLEK
jgi:carbamoyl-phosphate synthase small subunit